MSYKLAELLFKDKFIAEKQFEDAVNANKSGKNPIRYLIESKTISETKLLYYLSQKFGLASINLAKFEINASVIQLVSTALVRKTQMIPIQANQGTLVIALCDPTNLSHLDEIKFHSKMNAEAVLTSYSAFEIALNKYYGGSATLGAAIKTFKKDLKSLQGEGAALELVQVHEIDNSSPEQDAPVISLVNGILTEALGRMASDIHMEPYEKRFRARMRIDGILHEIAEIPQEMKRAVTARLKVMARMDIAESRIPQDGRIKLRWGNTEMDFRVNTIPTLFGEKVVLRILNKDNLNLDLEKLGFESEQLKIFKKSIYTPNGMVLVTGPTGSGKTTTLYSVISELNKVADNISTVEDPVEYNLDGINQIQTHKEIGLTFASILRSLLRQDPDIILVGEIRDYETAEVSVQAALTGHLVFSTLHTNDAASTIMRLMNMGLEPFLVVASLNAIIAQRLMRLVCTQCRIEENIPKLKLVELGMTQKEAEQTRCFKGNGCNHCNRTGYKGRIAIYEVLDFTRSLKETVLRGGTLLELKKQAAQEGMKTLRASALTKVTEGKTSLEEALSLTMEN